MSSKLYRRIPDEAREVASAFQAPDDIVGELFVLSLSETTTQEDLSGLLTQRPLIAARLVRLANCSVWGPNEAPGLGRAVQQLGGSAVPYCALVVAVANSLPFAEPFQGFDIASWHKRAWIRAVAALSIARLSGGSFQAEALACGLLQEIGTLALASAKPEEYAHLLKNADGEIPTLEAERETFGFDHIDVNAALFQLWRIPTFFDLIHRAAVIGNPSNLEGELLPLYWTMKIAQETVNLFEGQDKGTALTSIERSAEEAFELVPDIVYEFVSNLESHRNEVSMLFHPDSAPGLMTKRPRPSKPKSSSSGPRRLRDAPLRAELEHRRMLANDPLLRDEVCETSNRKAFEIFLDREVQVRLQGLVRRPVCCVVLSIDGWADKHRKEGEAAANEWLREASGELAMKVRRGDLYARLGGSYFGVCMSEADPGAMGILAQRLKETLDTDERKEAGYAHSISVGGAYLPKASTSEDGRQLLSASVRQLKRALADGGGGVEILKAPVSSSRAA